jgi:hypothetical protein
VSVTSYLRASWSCLLGRVEDTARPLPPWAGGISGSPAVTGRRRLALLFSTLEDVGGAEAAGTRDSLDKSDDFGAKNLEIILEGERICRRNRTSLRRG